MIRHYLLSYNKICYSSKTNNFSPTKQNLTNKHMTTPPNTTLYPPVSSLAALCQTCTAVDMHGNPATAACAVREIRSRCSSPPA